MVLELSNGMRVVLEKMESVRSICFGVWVKNGSRHENEDLGGVSHFIEHMLFKGTNKRTAKDIADEMDSIGGQMNAFTSKEYTCYYTRTLDTHIDLAVDVLADMFFHSVFDEAEIEKEKNVIVEEINMYEDTPEELGSDLLQLGVWDNYPLGNPVLGTKKSVTSFTQKTFTDYYKNRYSPKNIVIAVAGNFDQKDILDKIDRYFGEFKADSSDETVLGTNYKKTIVTKAKEIEQLHLNVAFPGLKMGHDDIYSMAALNAIFGGGMSSRLFQKIREEHGLAYSVYSYHSAHEDVGLFSIYAGIAKENAQEVLRYIADEVRLLKTDKITDIQLARTKEQLKSSYLLSLESSSSRMNSIGRSMTMLNRVLTADEVIEKIDKVTLDKVYDVYDVCMKLEDMSLSVVGDVEGIDFERLVDDAS